MNNLSRRTALAAVVLHQSTAREMLDIVILTTSRARDATSFVTPLLSLYVAARVQVWCAENIKGQLLPQRSFQRQHGNTSTPRKAPT